MSPTEKRYRKEFAQELFRIAEADLKTAKAIAGIKDVRPENTLFHIEQAVEKSIKAVLCHLQKPVPLTHDLFAVLQRLDEKEHPPGGYALHDLTPFATIRRYEEGVDIITTEDIAQAVTQADKVLDWARKRLS